MTGWVQRFLSNCNIQHPKDLKRKDGNILSDEKTAAETFWIKQAQAQAFPDGENEESLTGLNPKRDDNDLLRMDGRLRFADNLSYDTRHPICMPKNHPMTRIVIVDKHKGLGHGSGVEQVLAELWGHFVIVNGRRVAPNIVDACAECRRYFTTKSSGQMMAPSPKLRLQLPLGAFGAN